MLINKHEWAEWKASPVTEALLDYLKTQISEGKDLLAAEAGSNPMADTRLVGALTACQDIVDWQPEIEDDKSHVH